MAYKPVQLKIAQLLGGKANLRMASQKAGPVVTDNGNFIIDWVFEGANDWYSVEQKLKSIPGVIETGLFLDMATSVYFGSGDGSVVVRSKNA